jgi:hypothetical protein
VTKLQSLADRPEELKLCPYCSGVGNIRLCYRDEDTGIMLKEIRCDNCDSCTDCHWSDKEAIDAWNTRAYESELSKLRDLLDEAREIIDYVAGNDRQYSMRLKAENWLKDLAEVCGE